MSHRTSIKVRFYELDPYDHVNHAAYVQYFEVARIELLDEIGMGIGPLLERGVQLVVSELTIRYLASAGSGDVVEVETEVAEIRRASSRWRQTMRRRGEVLASQELAVVATDRAGKPVRLPAGMEEALTPFLAGERADGPSYRGSA